MEFLDIFKILHYNNAPERLNTLYKEGVIQEYFPELADLKKSEDEGGHKDNFVHTLQVLQNVIDMNGSIELRLVAVFHDLGKTKAKRKVGNKWTFHDHENISAAMLPMLFKKFVLPKHMYEKVYTIVKYHGQPKNVGSESSVRRLGVEVGEYFNDLIDFCKCDLTSKFENKNIKYRNELDQLRIYKEFLDDKAIKDAWRPPFTGNDVLDIIQTTDKRMVGTIKQELIDLIKNGQVKEDREDCLNWLKNKALEINSK